MRVLLSISYDPYISASLLGDRFIYADILGMLMLSINKTIAQYLIRWTLLSLSQQFESVYNTVPII